jgi:aldehyde:ferredoxin oxidoreductase
LANAGRCVILIRMEKKPGKYGHHGRILLINLNDRSCRTEEIDESVYRKFIGGRGLAGYFLRPYISLPWDHPSMPLLFFTGPLTDTISPASGRMTIMSRSPLTGTVGDCSVGGSLAQQLKKAGWDGLIITGQSDSLCGIEIINDDVNIADARKFAGLGTAATHHLIREKGATAVIGPAAENDVLFSSVIIDGHYAAGRGGIGLSMAMKKIKYLTVRGNKKTLVSDEAALQKARADVMRLLSASPVLMGEQGISRNGTGALYDLIATRNMMPTYNFRKTIFSHAGTMNSFAYRQRYQPKNTGCRGCPVLCKKKTAAGLIMPEFETMSHFSALIGNDNLEAVVEANRLCNDYGMDTISAAATVACLAEISVLKISPEFLFSLLKDISQARGIGAELGEGSYRYAHRHGRTETSMTVKKMELPGYDPRGAYGMALAYALSTRGGCHLRAYPISNEILRKPVATDRFTFDGKARIIKTAEDLNAVVDSLTACRFLFFAASLEEYANIYTAVTGMETCAEDLFCAGERIYYQERLMNYVNGFAGADDDLPKRFFNDNSQQHGQVVLPALNREDFCAARAKYYRIRGLDEDGLPLPEKAGQLELAWKV